MHPLEVVLQLQVGTDDAAVLSLPSMLSALSPAHFSPASPHLSKWIARVLSLIHSKHPGARWAGLCLALRTACLSKDVMTECSQSWVTVALPMLSRSEAPPAWKACIRLFEYIFTSAVEMPEFHRQLATPNVPKFSAALLNLAEKDDIPDVRHAALAALARLIPLYPNLHRTFHPSLSSLSFRLLSGTHTSPTSSVILEDACNLHAVLHFTGGKVGAGPLWRKSLDTALANAWIAFEVLRTTFSPHQRPTLSVQPTLDRVPADPAVAIPLGLDRLRCAVTLINKLLRAVTLRPVTVPIGNLIKLALRLLRCTQGEANENHPDDLRRALEISVMKDVWQLGCELVIQLALSVRHYLNPHLCRIVSHVTYHLEQPLPRSQHLPFLRALPPLLSYTHALHSPILATRLLKAILPFIRVLLSSQVEVLQQLQEAHLSSSKKGKKRARAYESNEVFRIRRDVFCPTLEDGEAVIAALDALDPLLSNPHIEPPVRTLAARLLVTLVLQLPRHSAETISPDRSLHGRVYSRVLMLCNKHFVAGASGWVNSAVELVITAASDATDGSEKVVHATGDLQRALDVLLHPRLPPLLLEHPPVEAIALFRSENVREDREARQMLGMSVMEDLRPEESITVVDQVPAAVRHMQLLSTQVSTTSMSTPARQEPTTASTFSNALAENPSVPTAAKQDTLEVPAAQQDVPDAVSAIVQQKAANASASAQEETFASPLGWQDVAVVSPLVTHPKSTGELAPRQEVEVASTSVARIPKYVDMDEDDEEMPEIDMRSDSD